MRILFLGGTGLTGPFAVRRLDELGHRVMVAHRGVHRAELPAGVEEVIGAAAGIEADVAVHMWLLTEADAEAFIERFRGRTGRAVVISSADVYAAYGRLKRLEAGAAESGLLHEDSPLRQSRYPYRDIMPDYDKVLVEQRLRAERELPVTILRYPAVYGPNDAHRFGPWLAQMDQGAEELAIGREFANWRWTHGYAEDVAEAVVMAATDERAAGGTYNVGEADTPAWDERLRALGRAAGWDGRIVLQAEAQELDYSHHLATDTSRIRRELGYHEIVPAAEALARTVAWERRSRAAVK